MSKYKVGDRVKVRDDLVVGEIYGGLPCVSGMLQAMGEVFTIAHTYDDAASRVDESVYYWTDEMFAGLAGETACAI